MEMEKNTGNKIVFYQNIHLFPEGFVFILCKYLHFICFVEIYKSKIPSGNKWIFLHMKTPSF